MTEPRKDENQTPKEPVVYASPTKRIWAWVGVAYMVIITLLVTYFLATATFIGGIGPIMLLPALCGCFGCSRLAYKETRHVFWMINMILMAIGVILGLVIGLPSLFFELGGVL